EHTLALRVVQARLDRLRHSTSHTPQCDQDIRIKCRGHASSPRSSPISAL
ncbi:MAG: hypothetical protein AVDCRST_MAG93-10065, partial [uncultured Chloroflexia bacterium]